MRFVGTREWLRRAYLQCVRADGKALRILRHFIGPAATDPLSGDFLPYHGSGDRRLTVLMDGSNKCNLRCVMCHFAQDQGDPIVHFSDVDLQRLESEILPRTKQAILSVGTEPLMWKGFPRLLRAVERAQVPEIELITNATLLTDEMAENIVRAGVTRVHVSVDSARSETYERIRQGARFEDLLEGIERIHSAKARLGAKLPELRFNITLMHSNLSELADTLRLAKSCGVRYVDLRHMVVLPGLDIAHESLADCPDRTNAALAEARELADHLGLEILRWPEPLATAGSPDPESGQSSNSASKEPAPEALRKQWATESKAERAPETSVELPHPPEEPQDLTRLEDLPNRPRCEAPWKQLYVRPNGTVVPCCFWYTEDHLGSLRESSFDEIWRGARYRRLRKELLQDQLGPNCSNCPMAQMGSTEERAAYLA